MAEQSAPAEGAPVFSHDGVHMGHVIEADVDKGWFKVDAPQAPDFWLPLATVREHSPGAVFLSLTHAEAAEQKWEGGEPEDTMLSPRGTRLDPNA
jgi:hypothetical protein